MAFNFNELKGRIVARYRTQSAFAAALGISETALSARLNNLISFKADEIKRAVILLEIPEEEINKYFFTL